MWFIHRGRTEVNESHIHKVPKNKLSLLLLFFFPHMGEVSELWLKTIVNMFFVVVFKSRQCFGTRN